MNVDDGPLNRRDGHGYGPDQRNRVNGSGPGNLLSSGSGSGLASGSASALAAVSASGAGSASGGTPGVVPDDRPGRPPDAVLVPDPPPRTPPRLIRVSCGDTTIELEWPDAGAPAAAAPAAPPPDSTAALPVGAPVAAPKDRLHVVRAPMVGTFFHAPEPGAKPFVGVGDTVRPGQTIGILEVMKMMNTITTEVGGAVVELHTPDAHPVEFEQPLITIEQPAEHPDDGGGSGGRTAGHDGHVNHR
jgi:acetyl-CoA carboxylase biotin carboxyl carrier protein